MHIEETRRRYERRLNRIKNMPSHQLFSLLQNEIAHAKIIKHSMLFLDPVRASLNYAYSF